MAASLLGGAALGPVFDKLLKAVLNVGTNFATFRSKFLSLKQTLVELEPVFTDIERLSKVLHGRDEEIEMFKKRLMESEELVRKCSKTKCYNALNKWKYSRKLTELENSLVKFCQIHGLIQVVRDSKLILVKVGENGKKLEEIHSMMVRISELTLAKVDENGNKLEEIHSMMVREVDENVNKLEEIHSTMVRELDENGKKLEEIQSMMVRDRKLILAEIDEHGKKLEELRSMMTNVCDHLKILVGLQGG